MSRRTSISTHDGLCDTQLEGDTFFLSVHQVGGQLYEGCCCSFGSSYDVASQIQRVVDGLESPSTWYLKVTISQNKPDDLSGALRGGASTSPHEVNAEPILPGVNVVNESDSVTFGSLQAEDNEKMEDTECEDKPRQSHSDVLHKSSVSSSSWRASLTSARTDSTVVSARVFDSVLPRFSENDVVELETNVPLLQLRGRFVFNSMCGVWLWKKPVRYYSALAIFALIQLLITYINRVFPARYPVPEYAQKFCPAQEIESPNIFGRVLTAFMLCVFFWMLLHRTYRPLVVLSVRSFDALILIASACRGSCAMFARSYYCGFPVFDGVVIVFILFQTGSIIILLDGVLLPIIAKKFLCVAWVISGVITAIRLNSSDPDTWPSVHLPIWYEGVTVKQHAMGAAVTLIIYLTKAACILFAGEHFALLRTGYHVPLQ